MEDLEFELSGAFGETVAVKIGGNAVAVVPFELILKKMAGLMGRTTSVTLEQNKEIVVYQGAQERWSGEECRLLLDGLAGEPLSRAQALGLARVLLAFSSTGEPLNTRRDARDWIVRLERASAL